MTFSCIEPLKDLLTMTCLLIEICISVKVIVKWCEGLTLRSAAIRLG